MLRFLVPTILSLAAISHAFQYNQSPYYSAASDAQIRFAIENKYDDTGPGAKQPEYAYNTYHNLEEALVGYLDDPDTKLPEHERNRALQSLAARFGENMPSYQKEELKRYYPKTVEEYTGFNGQNGREEYVSRPKKVEMFKGFRLPQRQVLTKVKKFYPVSYQNSGYKQLEEEREIAQPYRLQIVNQKQPIRESPLDIPYYSRESDFQNARDQFDPLPKYTFSYGVNAPETGDTKSAQETRDGGTVRGYYSFVDPDGKLRTVTYIADDKQGFRATVDRGEQTN